MTKHVPWFVSERAIAFASLVLTSQPNVVVRQHEAGADDGIDLLVEILKDGKSTLRFFGVQLVASLESPPVHETDDRGEPDDATDAMLPVCVFAIGARNLDALYRWIVEPVIQDGRAVLHRDREGMWQPLDEETAARIIDKVNQWYDVLNGATSSSRKGRGPHSKIQK